MSRGYTSAQRRELRKQAEDEMQAELTGALRLRTDAMDAEERVEHRNVVAGLRQRLANHQEQDRLKALTKLERTGNEIKHQIRLRIVEEDRKKIDEPGRDDRAEAEHG